MKRRKDWMVRLNKVLSRYAQGVDPETSHCGMLLADSVTAMTGTNPMRSFKAKTMEGLLEELDKKGFKDPVSYLASRLEEVPKNFAQVGDFAVFRGTKSLPAFGVVIGDMARVIRPDGSPGLMPVDKAKKVYRL